MAKGRHEHLLGQVDGLSVGSVPPAVHSVVSMGDRDLTRGRLPLGTDRWRTVVRPVQSDRRALPLALARNAAAETAVEEGADLLVFMGGDIIPGKRALERYADAVTAGPPEGVSGPVVWQGPLLHLPPVENEALGYPFGHLAETAVPTETDPVLEPGQLVAEPDWRHFRGCAFAMTAGDFAEVGGFCGDYAGHGLEDADFAEKVRRADGALVWVGGAASYTQPVPAPETADELRIALRHAATWKARWGEDPDHPMIDRLLGAGVLQRAAEGGYAAV